VDEDVKHIECASIHRFDPHGPFVMQYAVTPDWPSYRIRFAVSDDLRAWRKLGPEATFHPDPRWYQPGRWDTQCAGPAQDGGSYLALWDGKPKDLFGMAFGRSADGLQWETLPPFKQVVREGEDLWLKWWPGNEKAKAEPVVLDAGVPKPLDMNRGIVLEGVCRLPRTAETDLAFQAKATASQTADCGNLPGSIRPGNAIDGRPETFWASAGRTGEPDFFDLDLGRAQDVGRIELQWLLPAWKTRTTLHQEPFAGILQLSADGKAWDAIDSSAGQHSLPMPSAGVAQFSHWSCWQELNHRARYVRVRMPPFGRDGAGLGLCELSIHAQGRRDLDESAPGLRIACEGPDDYAILLERDGTVRFGLVGKDGRGFRAEIRRRLQIHLPAEPRFRLSMRRNLGEFYLEDSFVSSFKLEKPPSRIGTTGAGMACRKGWCTAPAETR
jgi:hypothetical protein